MDTFLFIGLPYAALLVLIVGTIYRYFFHGFKVSALSTQFLEGRQLFWGNRPFHWGIIFLFFGHLIAFLFPKSLIIWNTMPLRLLIIETSAFVFALLAAFGLVVLIYRRLTSKRLKVVTTKMDVFVYLIIAVQLISGIWLALSARWGSSWFASSISPYLLSIFKFKPDITVIISMPMIVKIHAVSAFVMFGMIPFTRFIHFLVYPFSYIWRPVQLVIWNWDRKKIRQSSSLVNGKYPLNN